MTDLRPAKTASGLEDEAQVIKMCRALDNCRELEIQLYRVICYLEHEIFVVNWNMDDEAKRRQKIRRDLILVAKASQ